MEKEISAQTYNLRPANEGERNLPKNTVQLKKLSEEEMEQEGSIYYPKKVSLTLHSRINTGYCHIKREDQGLH